MAWRILRWLIIKEYNLKKSNIFQESMIFSINNIEVWIAPSNLLNIQTKYRSFWKHLISHQAWYEKAFAFLPGSLSFWMILALNRALAALGVSRLELKIKRVWGIGKKRRVVWTLESLIFYMISRESIANSPNITYYIWIVSIYFLISLF